MRALACLCLTIWTAADVTPKGQDPRCQGHIWIVDQEGGRVLQVDRVRGVLREIGGFDRPRDLDVLPNGHVVVAGLGGRVVEVDKKGKEVWSFKDAEGLYAVRSLKNGNLLLATHTRVIEVDRNGIVTWEFTVAGNPQDVALQPDGSYLVSVYNKGVWNVSKSGGRGRERPISTLIMSIQPLPGDRVLVAEVSAQRVTEWDAAGTLVREFKVGHNVPSAHRTRRGGTLISGWSRVYEIDDQEKVCWEGPPVRKCVRVREY